MNTLILCVCLVVLMCCLTVVVMAGVVLYKTCFSRTAKMADTAQEALTEQQLKQIKEQDAAAQNFVEMMGYTGAPKRGDFR